jgi:hypothetical protein
MLMRAHDGRVDHHELIVRIGRQCLENAGKHSALAPPSISPVRRLPLAVTLRQVTPGDAREFIKGLKPTQIDGTEDKEITIKFPSGNERKFTGQVLLLNFSLPNFYFHYTTAYDILRNCGVELAKRDFIGTPVTLP